MYDTCVSCNALEYTHLDYIYTSKRGGGDAGGSSFVYDVIPFQYAGCYDGYEDDDPESFYSVYEEVFSQRG
jgi:hypothetical protein